MHTWTKTSRQERPISVLHLFSTFEVKTDTKWMVQLARQLDPAAFHLSAACFHGNGPVRERLEALGVRTDNLAVESEHDPRAVLRARRLINSIECDVVHTHLLRADLLGGAAARLAGTPAIVSTVYAIGDYRRARHRRSDRLLDAACAALPTHFVAVSDAVRRDCVDRSGIDPNAVTVIHTGIHPPDEVDTRAATRFRKAYVDGAEGKLVVALSRLSYEKGIDVLIDSAATLRQTHPSVRIVVVGDGPDRGVLEEWIRQRGVGDVVKLTGFREDTWPVLSAADLVCLPSKSEGMPNVLLEAMAASRPIVATTVGGIPEAVTHGHNGVLVPPERPEALAAAIGRVLDDPSWAGRMGREARRTVERRFHVRDVARRYGDLYQSLMDARKESDVGPAMCN